jgi:AcrR family transcriptional regulator
MTPKQDRAIRTRAALLQAAAATFSSKGWQGTNAKGVAKAAGVSVGSFYTYFPDKGAALRELAAVRFTSVLAGLQRHLSPAANDDLTEEDARRVLTTMVSEVITLHHDDPGLHTVFTERRHVDPELDTLTTHMERTIIGALTQLLTQWSSSDDPEATAFVCFGLVEGAVHAHVIGRPIVSDERLLSATVHALLAITRPQGSPS